MRREGGLLVLGVLVAAAVLAVLGTRFTGIPPLGTLLDPKDGLYRSARLADSPPPQQVIIPGLEAELNVEWDTRGVPHIFAQNDLDAVRAIGYVTARDRLFQLDFLPRAAAGRLSEALGPATVPADRFLRSTGMDWGARRNLDRVIRENGIELQILKAYADGVNAFLAGLEDRDLPLEFRLLGYRPDAWSPLRTMHLLQYMNYDLTYRTDRLSYEWLRRNLSQEDFDLLYPRYAHPYVPIIPYEDRDAASHGAIADTAIDERFETIGTPPGLEPPALAGGLLSRVLEGYQPGKGSNNWAVGPGRSTTGRPALAGDMHLSVTLPAIWYEVHVVTPSMNSYGVTIPGAPLPVEAFNDHLAWAFTNTGADQIDHYRIDVDDSSLRYRFEGGWRELELVRDTIFAIGSEPVIDTLRYASEGPVMRYEGGYYVLRWTAHEDSRTLRALYAMNTATNQNEFDLGLRFWDSPMQNILYADMNGLIGIRSTGHLPVRRSGQAFGMLDGSSRDAEWIGRVPFDELPSSLNPQQDFLTSTNQQPTDHRYPYYIGHDWGDQYRSLRIDTLLRGRREHSPEDLASYQADVHAVQHDLFLPLIDTLSGLVGRADSVRHVLREWDGEMAVDRPEPLVLHVFLTELERLAWDEPPFALPDIADPQVTERPQALPRPEQSRLYVLLSEYPDSRWLDIQSTETREDAAGLLRAALEETAMRLSLDYGDDPERWRWGLHRQIIFNHLIDSPALQVLGRGPYEYPGYRETLSPAASRLTTHSASWRMVVDFAGERPRGRGVYPGGQSGNPFSRRYDQHIPTYLAFEYYELLRPSSRGGLDDENLSARAILRPSAERTDE